MSKNGKPKFCVRCEQMEVRPAEVEMRIKVDGSFVKAIKVDGFKCSSCNQITYTLESMRFEERLIKQIKDEMSATLTTA